MAQRKSIPETTKLRLWTEAGGRCQRSGCNERLWEHKLTLSDGNFAQMAHIIGASENGPRGQQKVSILAQTDFENLMLLCAACHKEIDADSEKYPETLLREWKRDHEERIEIQTNITRHIHRSTILIFTAKIKDRMPQVNDAATHNAIFPKFPTTKRPLRIEFPNFGRENLAEWESAKTDIEKRIRTMQNDGYDGKTVTHLSVFAIGPMPLLMYLGKCIGDTISANIHHANRNSSDTNNTWTWAQESDDIHFQFKEIQRNDHATKVAVLLSVSDSVTNGKVSSVVKDDWSVYEIAIENPSPHLKLAPDHIDQYSKIFRNLLNQIQERNGLKCEVNIFPAIPAALAVESGRVLLPTKDPVIWVYEFISEKKEFIKVLGLQ
ncbi:MAG: SAVED domain-containing protein [Bacteroidia bacterium]|nr:SAVED domain-containing protein [Bacteroidia bacterium]